MGIENFSISVNNFGKIESHSLEIKPLTVITGLNNSGKSFFTRGLYSILSSLNSNHIESSIEKSLKTIETNLKRLSIILKSQYDQNQISELLDVIENISKSILNDMSNKSMLEQMEITKDVYIESEIGHFIKFFNLFEKKLKGYPRKWLKIKINFSHINNSLYTLSQLFSDAHGAISSSISHSLTENFANNFQVENLRDLVNNSHKTATFDLSSFGSCSIDEDGDINFEFMKDGVETIQKLNNIVYLDSPIFIRIKEVLQNNSKRTLFNKSNELSGYPKYIDDLFESLDKKNRITIDPDIEKVIQKMEESINGTIQADSNNLITYTEANGNQIPISLTAMGVSNIGLIALLLKKGIIKKDSFLILDEPEVHLHPKWQIELMSVLTKLSKVGVNIVITTHSTEMLKYIEYLIVKNNIGIDDISLNFFQNNQEFENLSFNKKILYAIDKIGEPFYNLSLKMMEP